MRWRRSRTSRRLRIHTRLPVVLPERIDDALLGLARRAAAGRWSSCMHANHANEFDAAVDAACARLRAAGATLLNQSVLLRGVNDAVDALAALSERCSLPACCPTTCTSSIACTGAAHFEVDDATARSRCTPTCGTPAGLPGAETGA